MIPRLLAILVQLLLGGALSAATAAFWVWQAVTWGEHSNWFDRMAQHGLRDLALIILLGAAVGLTVWSCGRYLDRPSKDHALRRGGPWMAVILASVGMLVLHFLVMTKLPQHLVAIDVSSVLRMMPLLPIVAFVPLGAALLGFWLNAIMLAVLFQIVIGGALSMYAAFLFEFGLSEGNTRGFDILRNSFVQYFFIIMLPGGSMLGFVVWLIGALGARRSDSGAGFAGLQLALTIASAVAGLVLSYLAVAIEVSIGFDPVANRALGVFALIAPIAGAMMGCWLWRSPVRCG